MLGNRFTSAIRPGFTGLRIPVLALAIVACSTFAMAADPEFVGVLSLAVEDEVAGQIGLSTAVRAKLVEVVDRRENDALEMILAIKDLPETERAGKLALYRAESERKGLALLTEPQRQKLRAIQISRMGMASLREPDVSARLELSPEQKEQIDGLLEERARAMADADPKKQPLAKAAYERKLAAVLTDDQRVGWEQVSAATPQPQQGPEKRQGPKEKGDLESKVSAAGPPSATGSRPAGGPGDGLLQFSFQYAPWKNVLEWFAVQADLSLVMDAPPPGTFNYTDGRRYSPADAIDLINGVLLTKGYTLVRRERMLMLINLEDGIPPNLIEQLLPEQLDERGEFELVSCLFTLQRMTPEDAQKQISNLLGPQGAMVVLPSSKQIVVTETAGKLRMIRRMIDAVADLNALDQGKTTVIPLQHATAEEVLVVARQLWGLPEDQNAAPDGTLRMAAGLFGSQIVASGEPHMVSRLVDLVKVLDAPAGVDGASGLAIETPQLEVYTISTADPASVLEVLQTLMAEVPDVRLSLDPQTGNLVALARPSQHQTIRATIDQMQRDARQVEVIRLWTVDPQTAVIAINNLFGNTGGEGVDRSAPRVDADPVTRSLLIRATQAQIAQIRTFLEKMGESEAEAGQIRTGQRGNIRMLPITGSGARRALEQAGLIWPSMRKNRLRTVTPSAAIRTVHPGRETTMPPQPDAEPPSDKTPAGETPSSDSPTGSPPDRGDAEGPTAYDPPPLAVTPTAASFRPQQQEDPDDSETTDAEPAEIIVTPGPRGVMIASEDLDALDAFEGLLLALADRAITGERELAVFYLKYAQAEVAAEMLGPFLGVSSSSGSSGGGSLLSNLAGAALGDAGGGMVGTLLGLGGGGGGGSVFAGTGTSIIADTRLNALVVRATPEQLDLAEQLLEVIDQNSSPEDVQTLAKPRLIPVFYMNAEEVAAIVRSVYAPRIGGAGAQQRQPSPEDFIRALKGGQNGRSSMRQAVQQQSQMTVGVDVRNNALIVSAPDPLFQDVQDLVARLEEAASQPRETVRVITLNRANPQTVKETLAVMLGDSVTTGTSRDRSAPSSKSSQQAGRPSTSSPKPPTPEQIRQRVEFFNALKRAGQASQAPQAKRGASKK